MKLWIMGDIEALRFFSDNKNGQSIVRQAFVQYDSDEYHALIRDMQALGCGAFFSVNRTNGIGATAADIMQVRTYYVDLDGVSDKDDALLALLDAKLKPSAIVETKRGFHAYWYASEQLPVVKDDYNSIQRGILKAFADYGADGSAKDIARVLRLPDTYHLKDVSNPFRIKIVHQLDAKCVPYYSRKSLLEAFPPPPAPKLRDTTVEPSPEGWLLYLTDLSDWKPKAGDRNMVMLLSAGVAIRFGVAVEGFVHGMLPIVRGWDLGRNEVDELWRVGRWAYAKGSAIPPYVVRNRGVPIRKGL